MARQLAVPLPRPFLLHNRMKRFRRLSQFHTLTEGEPPPGTSHQPSNSDDGPCRPRHRWHRWHRWANQARRQTSESTCLGGRGSAGFFNQQLLGPVACSMDRLCRGLGGTLAGGHGGPRAVSMRQLSHSAAKPSHACGDDGKTGAPDCTSRPVWWESRCSSTRRGPTWC
jgi:hypothetical protein